MLGLPAVDTCVALKGCRTIRNETAVTSAAVSKALSSRLPNREFEIGSNSVDR